MEIQQSILSEADQVRAEINRLKQLQYLCGVRLEYSPPGGTCGAGAKKSAKYARLRSGKGSVLPNGKKSKYIPLKEIPEYQAAIERGKQITQLEKRLQKLHQ